MLVTIAMNSAIFHLSPSSLNLTKSPPTRTTSLSNLHNFVAQTTPSSRWSPHKKSHFKLSSSQNHTATVASRATDVTAAEVVSKFYAGINGRDLPSVEDLISQSCVYEDLIFARPFVGRKVSTLSVDFPNLFQKTNKKNNNNSVVLLLCYKFEFKMCRTYLSFLRTSWMLWTRTFSLLLTRFLLRIPQQLG